MNLTTKSHSYYTQTRQEMIDFIPTESKKILEVGCGEGLFGQLLKTKLNAEVWGVEINSEAAGAAAGKLDKVIAGDISQLINELPEKYFDCIIFNDVLEHLIDPFLVLSEIKKNISGDGVIVCSIPNVRYFRTLKKLIFKKQWQYKDKGILDRTHLRFFTYKSIMDMINSLGYEILEIKGINAIRSWKFRLLNILLLGYLSDTKYLRYACIAKPA